MSRYEDAVPEEFSDDDRQRPDIPNHLVKSIVATACCCLPLGVVAIVNAAQVNGKIEAGRYREARRLSNQASTWANVGIVIGLLVNVIGFGFGFVQGIKNAKAKVGAPPNNAIQGPNFDQ